MGDKKRLIDANALEKDLRVYADNIAYYGRIELAQGVVNAVGIVYAAPTVDAVEVMCKVGALVYALWEAPVKQKYIIYCAEVKEIRISMRNCRLTTTYILEPIMYRGHRREYRDDDFGKLVFLSEKEAELSLTKMDGGNNESNS